VAAAAGKSSRCRESDQRNPQGKDTQHRNGILEGRCRAALKTENVGNGLGLLHLNRFFRTFGANKKQKSPAFNNLHDWSNHTFTLSPKTIQVVDWDRLVRSFLFEAAPKVRKNRIKCTDNVVKSRKTVDKYRARIRDLSAARQLVSEQSQTGLSVAGFAISTGCEPGSSTSGRSEQGSRRQRGFWKCRLLSRQSQCDLQ
jgi:hypothetical protein